MSLPFLLEIGTEEIPDWMIQPALENLKSLFSDLMKNSGFEGVELSTEATPRRLVLKAANVPERQADSEELVTGPPKAAPAGAHQGFARKMGIPVEALEVQQTPRGEYLAFRKQIAGKPASEILAGALPEVVLKIYFPKTMYWTAKSGPRFIRPIRWIVALLGGEVVRFEIAGVQSGNVTSGHRQLGNGPVQVTVEDHEARLKDNGVILPAWHRRAKILAEIDAITQTRQLKLKEDAALLDTLTYITEFPTVILGSFDPAYLDLPEEVLVTVMRHHQKYFSVEDESGKLAPHFLAVMNTGADPEGLVVRGNERVLRARFNDARFFWTVDQGKKLADRVPDLAHVTFQAKLGSYLDKTKRVVKLVRKLAKMAKGDEEAAARAALLSKADLTTEMVKELTELQGVMGGRYAQSQGEPEEVWRAVYEHYKPVSMEDSIPSTLTGRLVSLADKLDTLTGAFAIGMIPSGSRDPFALRRAAQGVVKILVEGKLALPFPKLTGKDQQLAEFLLDRIRYYFKDIRGFAYDEVNAVLAAGWDDLTDVESRLEAVKTVRPTQNFEPLAASFKRIKNILRQAEFAETGAVEAARLEPGPEMELYSDFEKVRKKVLRLRKAKDYEGALTAIASLRPKVDLFFDKVLVNAQDPDVRRNRLLLLSNMLGEVSAIADFSEIVTTQEPPAGRPAAAGPSPSGRATADQSGAAGPGNPAAPSGTAATEHRGAGETETPAGSDPSVPGNPAEGPGPAIPAQRPGTEPAPAAEGEIRSDHTLEEKK